MSDWTPAPTLADLPLFAPPPRPTQRRTTDAYSGHAPTNGSPTSQSAASRIEPKRPSLREVVFLAVVQAGEAGLTRLEIAQQTGIKENTVNARCAELINAGRIREPKGYERDTRGILVEYK